MKYALLIHDVPGAWKDLGDEERTAIMGEYLAITRHPGIVGGEQLQGAATGTTVRVSDGVTVTSTSGGPAADTEEFFGGFYMLQADDLDATIGLASRVPAARMGGSVEIRPVVER